VADTRARLLREPAEEAPAPTGVQTAIDAITALLDGKASDLAPIQLDMSQVPAFHRRVYEVSRGIPPGETRSYGEIARLLGEPAAARAVGQALGRNPFALVVPCHRVLTADGRLGGFSATGGVTTKLRLLTIEGAHAPVTLPLLPDDSGYRFDPAVAVAHLREADAALGRLIDEVGPYRMKMRRTTSVFTALAEAIVYQQLAGRAAATIYARVCALFPQGHVGPTPAHILRASDAKLRGAGLSANKILALRDLALRTHRGEIPTIAEADALSDEVLIERLCEVRGIGRWTVEMLLMLRLGRPDVLPVDDLGVRKGLGVILRKKVLPEREELARRGQRWAPYRSVASWYLWRAAERASTPALTISASAVNS
jgi:methylated-DNA-[protein]-cysteine S-methyltransferase